jgi:menaquinone-dependent protoporphyrinogen IX oxidase
MKTIILNGSPKGNSKSCNSLIFAQQFVKNMKDPCEIKSIANSDKRELASYIRDFDSVIIIMPLYIHAMPGIVMEFFEAMEPAAEGKSIGFIIQAGFTETSQERFIVRYLESFARKLNYSYLGTVCKGGAAAIYMMPNMFKKVLKMVSDLGAAYEETHAFEKELVTKLGKPYEIKQPLLGILRVVTRSGINDVFWHREMKKHNAYEKRMDRPFL